MIMRDTPVNFSERIRARAWRDLVRHKKPARWEKLIALAMEAHTIKETGGGAT